MQSKFGKKRALRFLYVLAALILFSVLVAACGGGSSSSSSSESTETAETSETSEGGGGSAKASEVSNKKIGYLDVAGTAPIQIRFQKAFGEAAKKFNWSVQLQDAAGEAEKALTGARNLINSGVDGIVVADVPTEWLLPIVPELESKNIPIIETITKEPPGLYTGQVLESQEASSNKMAEKVEEDFPQGGEVAMMFEEEIPSLVERTEYLEKAFKGTNIKIVANQNVPIAENPKAQKYTTDILNAHPNLAAVITTSDIQSPEVLAGLRTAGNSKVKVYGWYADSANSETMKQNPKQFIAVVDSDIAKVMWISAEELATEFSGGEVEEIQFPEYEPLIIEPDGITPGMLAEEGPVPFAEIGAPFYKEWETKFGLSG